MLRSCPTNVNLLIAWAILAGGACGGCGAGTSATEAGFDVDSQELPDVDAGPPDAGFDAGTDPGVQSPDPAADVPIAIIEILNGDLFDATPDALPDIAHDTAQHLCSIDRATNPSLVVDCGTRGRDASAPASSWLRVLPKGFWPAADGSGRVRVGLFWFNGFSAMPTDDTRLPDASRRLCVSAVPDLLPTGIVYYDLDLEGRTSEFVGMAVLHPLDADRLDSVVLGHMTGVLNRSPDVFMKGDEPPDADTLFLGRYVKVGNRFLRFELVSSDVPVVDSGDTPPLPGLYEFQVDISIPTRKVLALKVYGVSGTEGAEASPSYRLDYQGSVPLSVDIALIRAAQQAISGCGCSRDGATPIEVPARATCVSVEPSGFFSCHTTAGSSDRTCCTNGQGFYGLPWEGPGLVLYADCGALSQFRAVTGESTEMAADYTDTADLRVRGLPSSFQIGFTDDPSAALPPEGTVMLATLCGHGEEPPYAQCAFYLSTMFGGAHATLSEVQVGSATPPTIRGLLSFDDSNLPEHVAVAPCSRTWEFNLPVWDGSRE